eukprot:scaffold68735_cov66-Phaeocystis_antarctica.AAC.2
MFRAAQQCAAASSSRGRGTIARDIPDPGRSRKKCTEHSQILWIEIWRSLGRMTALRASASPPFRMHIPFK